jgi:hypothetical protein
LRREVKRGRRCPRESTPRGFARGRFVGIVEIVGELLGSTFTHRPFKMNPKDSWIEHLLFFPVVSCRLCARRFDSLRGAVAAFNALSLAGFAYLWRAARRLDPCTYYLFIYFLRVLVPGLSHRAARFPPGHWVLPGSGPLSGSG